MTLIDFTPSRAVRQLILLLAPVVLPALLVGSLGCREDAEPMAPTDPGGSASSHAAGHKVVTSLADPGDGRCTPAQCTLREAITDPTSTEISFASGLAGTITLARPGLGGGTLSIEKTLTITAPNSGVIIQRRGTDPAFRVFRVGSGVAVRLTNLTIRGGKPPSPDGAGGGVVNFGTLVLTDCTVAGNAAGGIANHQGTLTITNGTVVGNAGAGILSRQGRLTLANSTVAENLGGISNAEGALVLTHSTVARNSGRGITTFRGTATLANARIVGNSTSGEGGGIWAFQSSVTLTNSTIARNSAADGGGMANRDGSSVTLRNSTVGSNSATGNGGGIFNKVQIRRPISLAIVNSTVSGNQARRGGGIFAVGNVSGPRIAVTNGTVVDNLAIQEGGGILADFEALVTLTNALVARNRAASGVDVLDGDGEVLARFSLIGDGTGSGITNTDGNQVGNADPNASPIDPRVGPLADNGGPTRTHALLLTSPAIDAASTPDCPGSDQRGVLRPQGPACDIGSYERE
jgi:CSLREA domain-containing protein